MKQSAENMPVDVLDLLDELENVRGKPVEKFEIIFLEDNPKKIVQISVNLKSSLRDKIIKFLWANTDVFAWLVSDMPDIPTDVIIHKLNVDPNFRSIQ